MKKIVAFILAVLLIPSAIVYAADKINIDWKSLSNAEVTEIVNQGTRELQDRKLTKDGKTVVADSDELKVYITGRYRINEKNKDSVILILEAVFMNNCKQDIRIIPKNLCINGWDCSFDLYSNMVEIPANKMEKAEISMSLSDAECAKLTDIKFVEFSFNIYDMTEYVKPFATTEPITYVR